MDLYQIQAFYQLKTTVFQISSKKFFISTYDTTFRIVYIARNSGKRGKMEQLLATTMDAKWSLRHGSRRKTNRLRISKFLLPY